MSMMAGRLFNDGVAWADRSARERLVVEGDARARFLHNLTTNEVRRLAPGRGCEAFVTSLQGKTLGFVTILADADQHLLLADPGSWANLDRHFAKYAALDDVVTSDRSAATFEFHLAGARDAEVLAGLGAVEPPTGDLDHIETTLAGRPVRLVREAPFGQAGWTILGDRADAGAVAEALRAAGATELTAEEAEGLRLAAGTPVFGVDIGPGNLPQEVGRDARAISFVKGCYLGQETVARLDALGHVNRLLRSLRFEGGSLPPAGSILVAADGKEVGAVGSTARSPIDGGPIGLGYVRAAIAPGTTLTARWDRGEAPALVAELPG